MFEKNLILNALANNPLSIQEEKDLMRAFGNNHFSIGEPKKKLKSIDWEISRSSLSKSIKSPSYEQCRTYACNDIIKNLTYLNTDLPFITELPRGSKFCFLVRVGTDMADPNSPVRYYNQFAERNYISFSTITNKNVNDTLEICDKAYELGASGIEFNKIFIQGRAKNLVDIGLKKDDYDSFFSQIKEARDKYDICDLEVRRSGTFGSDTLYKPDRFHCSAGVKKVCITPDDKVYGCTCICKPGYEVGEIIDGEIYLYSDFFNDRSWCLGDKMGELGIENIQELNNPDIKKMVKKL